MQNPFGRFLKQRFPVLHRFIQILFLWGKPEDKGLLSSAELIVVQAMSDCIGGHSSRTNYKLAALAKWYQKRLNIPIFPQGEVGNILLKQGVVLIANSPVQSTDDMSSSLYITTESLAQLQKKLCDTYEWTTVLVIAPYPHAWRAIWTYEKLGLRVIIPENLPKMEFQKELISPRWRHRVTAYPYELLARLLYLYKGYI